jgi:hypothetical protein
MSTVKVDDAIEAYLALRKRLDEMKETHKAAEAEIAAKLEKLETFFLHFLNVSGGSSFQAKGIGTFFKQDVVSCSVKDWDATLAWIKEQDAWEFLERRVSKTVVQEYAAAQGQLPPGIDMTTAVAVRVRKAS